MNDRESTSSSRRQPFSCVPRRIRGIILDMDGTLTAPYFDFDGLERDVGLGKVDYVHYLAQADPPERARVLALIHRYEDDAAHNSLLNEGAREFLDWLHARGFKLALVTRNSHRSVQIVCRRFGLNFETVWAREDGPHKPDPHAILAISRQWGIPPAEILVVGDYRYDIEAGEAAGAPTALLTNGKPPKWANRSDFVVHRLAELMPILEKNG